MGVYFVAAPGCNAQAVVEYVIASWCFLEKIHGLQWRNRRLGIVGCGHVGGLLAQMALSLGMDVCVCDPWLTQAAAPLVSLDELLATADIVSLHVPMVREGAWPTLHLLGYPQLQLLKKGAWLINTSRGEVVELAGLQRYLQQDNGLKLILDVWPGEPVISMSLLSRTVLGTPHVAGYSYEGKVRGTAMVCQALAAPLGQSAALATAFLHPTGSQKKMRIPLGNGQSEMDFARAMLEIVPLLRDDAALRALGEGDAQGFDRLRAGYPQRFECAAYVVPERAGRSLQELCLLGATVAETSQEKSR